MGTAICGRTNVMEKENKRFKRMEQTTVEQKQGKTKD
jgi:hypothetical protein